MGVTLTDTHTHTHTHTHTITQCLALGCVDGYEAPNTRFHILSNFLIYFSCHYIMYRGADKSLPRPGRKQAWKHVRDARDFNNIETRAVIKFVFLQGKAPKEIHAILTETLACFLPGRAKDLSAPL